MTEDKRASFVCESQEVKNNPYNYDSWFDYLCLMESEGDIDATREAYERAIANVPLKKEVKNNPYNYDSWFDYLCLMESEGDIDATREAYERAIANVPLKKEKQYWRRYIYLWINYASFEELQVKPVAEDRTRQVYQACLKLIPHKTFTFAKIWLLAAQYEIREKNFTAAEKLLDTAIGMRPKAKLYRGYIDLEIQLREFDKCNVLFKYFLESFPEKCKTWMQSNARWQEYYDYIFPDHPYHKLLEIIEKC